MKKLFDSYEEYFIELFTKPNIKIIINDLIFFFNNDKLLFQYSIKNKKIYYNYFSLRLSMRLKNVEILDFEKFNKLATNILGVEVTDNNKTFFLVNKVISDDLQIKLNRILKINDIYS